MQPAISAQPPQPTFGNAMSGTAPLPGFPGMPSRPMMFPNPMQPFGPPVGQPAGMMPNSFPAKLPMPPLGPMPFAAPKPFMPSAQVQPAFPPVMPQQASNPAFPQMPQTPAQPQQTAMPPMPEQPSSMQPAPQATAPATAEQPQAPAEQNASQASPQASSEASAQASATYPEMENDNKTPISDLNTMIAQPRTPDEKLAAINEIATRQQGDRQTYELLKQEISTPMQGIPPETASAIRQAALIALGSLNGNPINAKLPGIQLYGMEGIDRILNDKNENPLIKASAVAALGYMNRPQDKTIQKLLKKAAKDTNPDVKNAVAQVQLGQMSVPSAAGTKAQ